MARRPGTFHKAARSPLGIASGILLAVIVLLAIFAPILWTSRANALDVINMQQGPSARHWLRSPKAGWSPR